MASFISKWFGGKKNEEKASALFEEQNLRVSVRLLEVQGALSKQEALDSLKSGLPSLHKLVKDAAEQNTLVAGKFALVFRTEPNGMIRMVMENKNNLTGDISKDFVSKFIGTAMSAQWQFAQTSGISLVQAEFIVGS